MNVLIIAHFTRDFSATDNGRFSYLAKELAKEHNVEIVTTSWSRRTKGKRIIPEIVHPYKITLIDEPGYGKNVTLKRFYSHHIWGKNLKKYLETIPKPDVVYCAIPSLTGPRYAADYCERNGIRFVVDVQDLWPEAFNMVFNVPVISSLVFRPFNKLANHSYSAADGVCAVSKTYVDRVLSVNQKVKTGNTVFLGTNLSTFDGYASQPAKLKKQNNEVWLAYCGTLGSSYDLTCVFDALEIISNKELPYKFIIMGSGPKREEFEQYAKIKNLNTVFTGRLEYSEMCAQLCECDICINPIMHNAAQSITNKHGDYASSGLPVVSTQENEEYRNLVEEYHMGFNCHNNDAADLAEKIERLILDENLRKEMGANARRCAEERFDRRNSYKALISEILGGVLS